MLLNNATNVTPSMYAAQFLLSSFRYRVLALFDLQFILVTGKNRNNESLTFGELINLADEHLADYTALSEIWGEDNPILLPVRMALTHIQLIQIEIDNGRMDQCELVNDFAKEQPESVRNLAIAITKSLKIVGGL